MQRFFRLGLVLLFFLVFLLFPDYCDAADYYVDPAGNGDFTTIQAAVDVVQAGDAVYIRSGTYPEQVVIRSTGGENNLIKITAVPGEEPVLDGGGVEFSEWAHHVEVSGLTIRNTDYGVYGYHVSEITVKNCEITNTSEEGIYFSFSSNVEVINNYTYSTGSSGIGIWECDGVVVLRNEVRLAVVLESSGQECITIARTRNFEVVDNLVHEQLDEAQDWGAGIGIDIKSRYTAHGKVYGNKVWDLPHDIGIYLDAWNAGTGEVSPDNTNPFQDVEVYNNEVWDTEAGIRLGSEHGGNIANIKIYNNIVRGFDYQGIEISDYIASGYTEGYKRNVDIVNNTVYSPPTENARGIALECWNVENINVNNNLIFIADGAKIRQVSDSNEYRINNNLIAPYKSGSDYVVGQNPVLVSDPGFVNADDNDLHLRADSSAINPEMSSLAPVRDFDGQLRDDWPDIGAYEYQGGEPNYDLAPPDGDGKVNTLDFVTAILTEPIEYLLALLQNWGEKS